MTECLDDKFSSNKTDDLLCKQVRRGGATIRNTSFGASIQAMNGIKNLKHNKDLGHNGLTNIMMIQLPCHFINHLVHEFTARRLEHFLNIRIKEKLITISKPGNDQNTDCLGIFTREFYVKTDLSCLRQ